MSLMHEALREMEQTRAESGTRPAPLSYDTSPATPVVRPSGARVNQWHSAAADMRTPHASVTNNWTPARLIGGALCLVLAAWWWIAAKPATIDLPSVALAPVAAPVPAPISAPPKVAEVPPSAAVDNAVAFTPMLPAPTEQALVPPAPPTPAPAPVVALAPPTPPKPTVNVATPKPAADTEKPRAVLITDDAQSRSIGAARALATAKAGGHFTAIAAAIEAGDMNAAKLRLARLEEELPAGSLTLLRAQAWVLNAGHEPQAARAAYAAILARLPDDENALLNLANLEMKDGKLEAASILVAGALQRSPDSTAARATQVRIARASEAARASESK